MRVSIITLTIDSSDYVDEAIGSVEHQGPYELEHIVVHDGTEGFTRRLAQKYPHIKFVGGSGTGATAAAALGVEASTGDFILLVHSDDRIRPGVLARLASEATARPDVKIWTGGAQIFCTLPGGEELVVRRMVGEEMTRLSLANICDDMPLLSARFCHRSVFSQIGNFDPMFSESSDREFLLRATIAGVREGSLDVVVSEMRMHQDSRTMHFRNGFTPPYLEEHTRIADQWLARADIPDQVRRFLRNWRAREMLRLLAYQCRARQWKEATQAFFREERADPSWLARALSIVSARRRRHRFHNGKAVEQLIDRLRVTETK
jgi:glycosyltransferase involved in cell wall biosynthesis